MWVLLFVPPGWAAVQSTRDGAETAETHFLTVLAAGSSGAGRLETGVAWWH